MICQNCGNIIEDGARFCQNCGIKVEREEVKESTSPFDQPFVPTGISPLNNDTSSTSDDDFFNRYRSGSVDVNNTAWGAPLQAPNPPSYETQMVGNQAPADNAYAYQSANATNAYGSATTLSPSQIASRESLFKAAAIINWVVMGLVVLGTIFIGVFIIAWFIPMTVSMHRIIKRGDYRPKVALGVCTLLFCNLISGVLILAAPSDPNA